MSMSLAEEKPFFDRRTSRSLHRMIRSRLYLPIWIRRSAHEDDESEFSSSFVCMLPMYTLSRFVAQNADLNACGSEDAAYDKV